MKHPLRLSLLIVLATFSNMTLASSSQSNSNKTPKTTSATQQKTKINNSTNKQTVRPPVKKSELPTLTKQAVNNKQQNKATPAQKKTTTPQAKLIVPTSKKRKPQPTYTISELRAGKKYNPQPPASSTRTGPNINYYPSIEPIHNYAQKAQFDSNVFTIGAHGALLEIPYTVDTNGNVIETRKMYYMVVEDGYDKNGHVKWRALPPDELYKNMKMNGYQDGQDVVLASCNLGHDLQNGTDPYAKQLAAVIRQNSQSKTAKVYGADNYIWFEPDGNNRIAPSDPLTHHYRISTVSIGNGQAKFVGKRAPLPERPSFETGKYNEY